jgi:hypothetical protein
MIKFFHYSPLLRVKSSNFFANFFGENILKNYNIGPRGQCCDFVHFVGFGDFLYLVLFHYFRDRYLSQGSYFKSRFFAEEWKERI